MRAFALCAIVLAAGWAVQAASQQGNEQPAAIFAGYDCCGRLEHSEVKRIGDIHSGGRTFTVYSLWFVNPQSRHGMKRLAVVEGRRFLGSYIISSWARPFIQAGEVKFVCDNGAACEGDKFAIVDGKPPYRLWVDGEISQLEDTI